MFWTVWILLAFVPTQSTRLHGKRCWLTSKVGFLPENGLSTARSAFLGQQGGVFSGKVPFFLKKEAGALRKRLFQRKKASRSLETRFWPKKGRFQGEADVFSDETRIFHGRGRISGAKRTLPTPEGAISTMGAHEIEVGTLATMV